ncbi:unnamed protein product [Lactuca saligna]|uniref:Uncharacterized protein n=1 Tax=Lactuca saligna TaxID=75948 RepID=A0AA35YZ25_LACSI|nr:unnamed protein product [Lactuca saligna]
MEMSAKDSWEKYMKIKSFTAKGATSTTLRVEYSWIPKRCDHCKLFGHDLATCLTHTTSSPVLKTAMPIPKEVDKECFQTVKRRARAIHILKKKVQVDNRKSKGFALKIAQVYKLIIRDPKTKNVSTNMFDAFSHQRVNDTKDGCSIPPNIYSRDTLPTSDTQPSFFHCGHISNPVDES